eukprot:TRINITY_DN338_c0_g4_i1.p1 TRINITY_DN338_c0_g4~~TRINITY_DN338_c0_g4_i1.p1  ORF type:complete len:1061 (+),score=113.17 TRINITY_DN338_c0_g4_i1:65-3184(+)
MSDDGLGLAGRRHTLPQKTVTNSPGVLSLSRYSSVPGLNLGKPSSTTSGNNIRTRSGLIRKHLDKLDTECHVTAVVRVRPLLDNEEKERCLEVKDGTEIVVADKDVFVFDKCFSESDKTDQISQEITKPLLSSALAGYNSCVFAFGQTSSGKTHTMLGTDSEPGLIPHVITNLFKSIDVHNISTMPPLTKTNSGSSLLTNGSVIPVTSVSNYGITPPTTPLRLTLSEKTQNGNHGRYYEVACCFMEIYKEKVRDLLLGTEDFKELKIRNSPIDGPYVDGLTSVPATSAQQLLDLVKKGGVERTTGSTAMNSRSSRSHAVFQIVVTETETLETRETTTMKTRINLVDLAGSEKAKTTTDIEETTSINLSLTTLRRVIDALIENSKKGAANAVLPPYRESKLTWLLSESLGGNTKTVMVGTISPCKASIDETLNTLRYTLKAKGIVNRISKNEDKQLALIRLLRTEVSNLQARVSEQENILDISTGQLANLSTASVGTPREINDTMDVTELRRQLQVRNKIIEELNIKGMTSSGRPGVKDTGVQAVEHVLSASITISAIIAESCKLCEEKRSEITASISSATSVPLESIVDLFLEPASDTATRVSCVATTNPSLLNKNRVKQIALMKQHHFPVLDFHIDVAEVNTVNLSEGTANPILALSPKGLQGQLLSEQRHRTELNNKVRMLQHTVAKLKRVEANQGQVFENMAKEIESLCGIIREKNDENLQLSSAVDQLVVAKSQMQREINELQEGKETAERQERAVNIIAESTETECLSYQERLVGLSAALEHKVRVTQSLSDTIGKLREENKSMQHDLNNKEELLGEEVSLAASKINGLVTTNTEIEVQLSVEKEARMKLGEERRLLTIQHDQLKRDYAKVKYLLEKRGLVIVGCGSTQQLMTATPANTRARSFTPPSKPHRGRPSLGPRQSDTSFDRHTPPRRAHSASLPVPSSGPRGSSRGNSYGYDYSPHIASSDWYRPTSPLITRRKNRLSAEHKSPSIHRPASPPVKFPSSLPGKSLNSVMSPPGLRGGRVPAIHKNRR